METKEILNILRKPYGHSADTKRKSRQAAADMIEKLLKENEELKKPKEKKMIVNPEAKDAK